MSDTPCDNRCIRLQVTISRIALHPPARRQTASPRWASLLYINSSNYAPILSASATHMILFMPWPVQKYITTHLYIIAEFVEWSKWGRRGLLLHFALLHTHCALIPNCSALRAPAILRGIHTPACRPSCSCRVIPSNALHAASKLSHVRA